MEHVQYIFSSIENPTLQCIEQKFLKTFNFIHFLMIFKTFTSLPPGFSASSYISKALLSCKELITRLKTDLLPKKMLHPLRHQLNSMRVVLASGSPRRQELIQNLVSLNQGFSRSKQNLHHVFLFRGLTKLNWCHRCSKRI